MNSQTASESLPLSGSPAASMADQTRLRGLVKEHFNFIWRSLRRLGISEADVEDATQQVFFVAASRLATISPGSERSFLLSVALHEAAHVWRRNKRNRCEVEVTELDTMQDSGPGPEEVADWRRAREILDTLLDGMPIDLRAVFVLYEIEEMSMVEVSRVLEIPIGTTASRLRRARQEFESRLERIQLKSAFRGGSP